MIPRHTSSSEIPTPFSTPDHGREHAHYHESRGESYRDDDRDGGVRWNIGMKKTSRWRTGIDTRRGVAHDVALLSRSGCRDEPADFERSRMRRGRWATVRRPPVPAGTEFAVRQVS